MGLLVTNILVLAGMAGLFWLYMKIKLAFGKDI
jgi:hypothetical protein